MKKLALASALILAFNSIAQTLDCSQIVTSSVDKITGTQTKTTKHLPFKGAYALVESPVTYMQTIKNGDTSLYVSLQTYGTTLNIDGKGVILLFADGTKIERPEEKINYAPHTGGYWKYSAFMELSKEEVEIITKNEIEIIRLFIYDANLPILDASAKGAKTLNKYNSMIRNYIKESLICLIQS
jgi:hypothetical protein